MASSQWSLVFILLANRCQPAFLCWGQVSTCVSYGAQMNLGVHRTQGDTHFLDPIPGGYVCPALTLCIAEVFTAVCFLRYLMLCTSVSTQEWKCCSNKGHMLFICPRACYGTLPTTKCGSTSNHMQV